MLNVQNAIVSLLSDNNLWCSAFLSVLIFGEVEDFLFNEKRSFKFYKTDFYDLYKAIVQIIKHISNSLPSADIILERKAETEIYSWTLKIIDSKSIVCLIKENNYEITFKAYFSLEEFNDFVLILSQTIIPTFCTKSVILKSLDTILLNCTLDEIKNLVTLNQCFDILTKFKLDQNHAVYLFYYKEVLIVVFQLKSLYNPEIKKKISDEILHVNALL